MTNPHKYILQDTPKPAVSIALSIVGPPKSGKSTSEYVNLIINYIAFSVIHCVMHNS